MASRKKGGEQWGWIDPYYYPIWKDNFSSRTSEKEEGERSPLLPTILWAGYVFSLRKRKKERGEGGPDLPFLLVLNHHASPAAGLEAKEKKKKKKPPLPPPPKKPKKPPPP